MNVNPDFQPIVPTQGLTANSTDEGSENWQNANDHLCLNPVQVPTRFDLQNFAQPISANARLSPMHGKNPIK